MSATPFKFKSPKKSVMLKPTELVLSRTFNDGNYESTRIELRVPVEVDDDIDAVFALVLNKIYALREHQLGA